MPTFIEDVGSAAAENVRSAALRRWIHADPANAHRWLRDVGGISGEASELHVKREVVLNAESRIDLQISTRNGPIAFVEVKWASPPDDEQLGGYRKEIDSKGLTAPLILLSPVRHVVGQGITLPVGIHLSDWAQLFKYISLSKNNGSIEDDLHLTIARWVELRAVVRESVRTEHTTVGDIRELIVWIDDSGSLGADLKDYRILLRQLILAEIADAFVDSRMGTGWRRCLTNRGASGDFQADVAPASKGDGWFPCPGESGFGVALMLRFHADSDFQTISVNIGSAVLPYLEGNEKRKWCSEDTEREKVVFEHAAKVRRRAFNAVSRAGFQSSRRADTREWYKRIYGISFSDDASISELVEHATKLSRVLIDVSEEKDL